MGRHNINVSDDVWAVASEHGSASAYIAEAIREKCEREARDAEERYARRLTAHLRETGEMDAIEADIARAAGAVRG